MTRFDPLALGRELRDAERRAGHIALPTDRFDDFGWSDARATARARDALRLDDGEQRIGYKLGWTSAAMREALGLDRPNWGTLWSSQVLDDAIDADRFVHAKVEPEIVYVAGDDLTGSVTVADVIDAAAGWAIGLEVVDPRFESFDFRWLDNTADNSSAAGVRTGETTTHAGDPADLVVEFTDGATVRHGTGAAAMGSPAAAVAWLVQQLDAEGTRLERGERVYTGGVTAPFDVRAGLRCTVHCPDLGTTSLTVAKESEPCR